MSLNNNYDSNKSPPKQNGIIQNSNNQHENMKSEIAFLNQKNQTLEERLLTKTRENETFISSKSLKKPNEVEISLLKNKINDLEQKNLLLTRENDYYRKITSNKEGIELKTTKIVELEQNCSKLLQENTKLNDLCKKSLKEIEGLNEQLQEFQKKSYDPMKLNIYNEISEMSQKITGLESQMKEYKSDNEFLAYKIKEKEIDHKNIVESLENSNKKLINDNRVLLIEKEKLIDELKNHKDKNSVLSLENRDMENKLNNLKKELETEMMKNFENEKKLQKSLENNEDNLEKKQEISKLLSDMEKKTVKIKEFETLYEKNAKEAERKDNIINNLEKRLKEAQIIKSKENNSNGHKEIHEGFEKNYDKLKENSEEFDKLIKKCRKLKEKNKVLSENLTEQANMINTLKIYQDKYEVLFKETKEFEESQSEPTEDQMKMIILLAAENDRLHSLIRDYAKYQQFQMKNSNQFNQNLNEYNNLCILVKDLERKNKQFIDENNSLKILNDQKTKEINRLMIENSQWKKKDYERGDLLEQQIQQISYENANLQQQLLFNKQNMYNNYY